MSGRLQKVKGLNRYYRPLRQQATKPGLSMILSARPEADIQVLVAARYLPTLGASLTMSGWRQMSG
jgi:hypothetical protein